MREPPPFDVVCVGSSTEDVFVLVGDTHIIRIEDRREEKVYLALEYGAKIRADDLIVDTGGGATNTAVTFARMGLRTAIVSKVGDDGPGQRVREAMETEGIDTEHLVHDPEHRTGYSVIITGFTGDRTILVHRGASSYLRASEVDWQDLRQTSWVYMNSLAGESAPLFGEVAAFCAQHGVKLAINPGTEQRRLGVAGLREVLQHTAALFVNRSEAYEITGVPPDRGPDDEMRMLTMLREAGCQRVIMTYGAEGSEGMDASGHYRIPAAPADKVVSTVGAGDAFASACVVALHRGLSLPEAMRVGAANAASVIQQIGAKSGILTWEQAVKAAGLAGA